MALLPWLFKSLKASKDGVEFESQEVFRKLNDLNVALERAELQPEKELSILKPLQIEDAEYSAGEHSNRDNDDVTSVVEITLPPDSDATLQALIDEYREKLDKQITSTAPDLQAPDVVWQLVTLRVEIEHELRRIARMAGMPSAAPARYILNRLRPLLPSDVFANLTEVLDVANRAIHGVEIKNVSVSEVAATGNEIIVRLRKYWLKPESLRDIAEFRMKAKGFDGYDFTAASKDSIGFALISRHGTESEAKIVLLPAEPTNFVAKSLKQLDFKIAWPDTDGFIRGDGPYWLINSNDE